MRVKMKVFICIYIFLSCFLLNIGNVFSLDLTEKKGIGGIYYERIEIEDKGKGTNNGNVVSSYSSVNEGNSVEGEDITQGEYSLKVYTKKYSVPFLTDLIKDQITQLLHNEEGRVIIYGNGEVIVEDDYIGQKRIEDYINKMKDMWLSEWKYKVKIVEWKESLFIRAFSGKGDRRKKERELVYEGIVSPLTQARIGDMGRIAVIPQVGMYMFNIFLPKWGIQESFFVRKTNDRKVFVKGNTEVWVEVNRVISVDKQDKQISK